MGVELLCRPLPHQVPAPGETAIKHRARVFMKRTADKLFGDRYRWSVLAAGAAQMDLATAAATMGGNVRVGLEDSLFISRGRLATSNAEQVHKIRRMLEDHGLEIACPDEARKMLGLKGAELTRF